MLTFQTRQEPLVYDQVALIASPNGDIDDRSVHQFHKQLQDYYDVGYRWVILNCAGIQLINSAGLEILLKMVETYQQGGGFLLLTQTLPQISKFFDKLGYSPIFSSFSNKEEAIAFLTKQLKEALEAEGGGKEEKELTNRQQGGVPKTAINSATPPISAPQPIFTQMSSQSLPFDTHPGGQTPSPIMQQKREAEPKTFQPPSVVDIQILYYRRMYPSDVFPLKVQIEPSQQGAKGEEMLLNVIPYFPGCLVTPSYRTAYLQENQEIVFWITPLVAKKIEGWVEFWKGEESACYFILPCKIKKQRLAKILFLMGLAAFALMEWGGVSVQPVVSIVRNALVSFVPGRYINLLGGGIFWLLAFMAYLANRPRQSRKVLPKVTFQQGMFHPPNVS